MTVSDEALLAVLTAGGAAAGFVLRMLLEVVKVRDAAATTASDQAQRQAAAIASQFQALIDELREARAEERSRAKALGEQVAALEDRVTALTAHVARLEDLLRQAGHEPPPRPRPYPPATSLATS